MATVLVVDDEADILEVIRLGFENAGYRVLTAEDGAAALEVVDDEVPDVLLLDVGMPRVDGWQVLERIKSSTAVDLARVPVVMVTAWSSEDDRLRGGIEGAVRYVAKPFDPSELVRVVDELLGPDARPEPELRREVQWSSLERLARRERGAGGEDEELPPRVHLTRLDRPRVPVDEPAGEALTEATLPEMLDSLSPKQRQVVEEVLDGVTVADIATVLGVSRSNVYAILRRVAKKAGLEGGRSLIRRLHRIGASTDG